MPRMLRAACSVAARRYYDCRWIRELDDAPAPLQNGFSAAFREKLRPLATLDAGLDLQSVTTAADGTRKLVFRLRSGPAAGGQVRTHGSRRSSHRAAACGACLQQEQQQEQQQQQLLHACMAMPQWHLVAVNVQCRWRLS